MFQSQNRKKVAVDCSEDKPLTEQAHKKESDINNIVKRHGLDMIAKTALLQTLEYQMDEIPTNDFQEAMEIITRAQQHFEQLPSKIRTQFDNKPAKFMDFIQNPANSDALIEMGLAEKTKIPEPIQVAVTNQETPPEIPISDA